MSECGSFRKASLRVEMGQSAISRRIQRLEDFLGVSLFERKPSGVAITPAGSGFAERARGVLRDIDAAVSYARSAGTATTGHLCVGLVSSLSYGSARRLFSDFLERHAELEVCWTEADQGELYMLLSHRRLDVVILKGMPLPTVGDNLTLSNGKIFVAVPRNRVVPSNPATDWSILSDLRLLVSTQQNAPKFHRFIVAKAQKAGKQIEVRYHRVSREGIMALVGLGVGATVVGEDMIGVAYPNVDYHPFSDFSETYQTSIVWLPENDNPALRRFISLARIEAKRNGLAS
ncbi:LysR family transcriptional regulator [Roseovarius sp. C03]|uniref:LysR family transcriptional regulator n=1 Tax=Roseovarius sp. C03 TaxID=3449222 RepID=UPI003EDC448A